MQNTIDQLTAQLAALQAENAALKADLTAATTSNWFGCLTREGVNLALRNLDTTGLAAIFWDVDKMKAANERWGKVGSSGRVKAALRFRQSEVVVCGQWFSGDEFVAFVPVADAVAFAERLQRDLAAQEMSATFGVAACEGRDTLELVDALDQFVADTKAAGTRAAIVEMR